jgi:hypothetical protein
MTVRRHLFVHVRQTGGRRSRSRHCGIPGERARARFPPTGRVRRRHFHDSSVNSDGRPNADPASARRLRSPSQRGVKVDGSQRWTIRSRASEPLRRNRFSHTPTGAPGPTVGRAGPESSPLPGFDLPSKSTVEPLRSHRSGQFEQLDTPPKLAYPIVVVYSGSAPRHTFAPAVREGRNPPHPPSGSQCRMWRDIVGTTAPHHNHSRHHDGTRPGGTP